MKVLKISNKIKHVRMMLMGNVSEAKEYALTGM